MLARAFRDNPLNRAVIRSGDPSTRLRSNLHGMRSLLPAAAANGQILVARDSGRVTTELELLKKEHAIVDAEEELAQVEKALEKLETAEKKAESDKK